MIDEIQNWLEHDGWTKEIINNSWSGSFIKSIPIQRGQMIVNGQPVQTKPEYIHFSIQYENDGWIEGADGSNHEDTTQWKISIGRDLNNPEQEISIIVTSLSQFQKMLNEL